MFLSQEVAWRDLSFNPQEPGSLRRETTNSDPGFCESRIQLSSFVWYLTYRCVNYLSLVSRACVRRARFFFNWTNKLFILAYFRFWLFLRRQKKADLYNRSDCQIGSPCLPAERASPDSMFASVFAYLNLLFWKDMHMWTWPLKFRMDFLGTRRPPHPAPPPKC